MPKFSLVSLENLQTCHVDLQDVALDAIEIVDFKVTKGHRGEKEQNQAVKDGASTKPWPTGNHNALPSNAFDFAPVYYEKGVAGSKIDWGDLIAFGRIAGVLQACAFKRGIKLRFGLDWDGDFRSVNRDTNEKFLDAPHVERVK